MSLSLGSNPFSILKEKPLDIPFAFSYNNIQISFYSKFWFVINKIKTDIYNQFTKLSTQNEHGLQILAVQGQCSGF